MATVQYYWLGIRAEGGAGNAIVFATVACLATMTCIAGRFSDLVQWNRALTFAALAGTVAILLSGSRIIWFAAPVVAGVLLFIYRRNFSGSRILKLIPATMAIVAVIGIFGFHTIMARSEAALSDIASITAKGDYDTPIGLRVALWKIGLEEFRQSPIFGHGAGATKALIKNGMLEDFGLDRGFSHFHNGFLTALVEGGLLCLASLASIFLVAVFNAIKALRNRRDPSERFGAAMVLIAVTTYLIAGLTGILVGHDILDAVLMIFLIVGTYLGCGRMAESARETGPRAGPAAR